jgi:3-hydroxyacyl-CoA dehydrogenase
MEWGFGWEVGPFALTDLIGVGKVRRLVAKEGLAEPRLLAATKRLIYKEGRQGARRVLAADGGYAKEAPESEKISAAAVRRAGRLLEQNEAAALLDLEDGVALLQFRSKMGTLGDGVVQALIEATARLSGEGWVGLVVGHDDPRAFSAGANLVEMLQSAKEGRWDAMEARIRSFQRTIMGLRRAPFHINSLVIISGVK